MEWEEEQKQTIPFLRSKASLTAVMYWLSGKKLYNQVGFGCIDGGI